MKNLILFDDDDNWRNLLPLTYTKPISELRIGILTIREKWELAFDATASYITQDHLSHKFPITIDDDNVLINSSYVPTDKLIRIIDQLQINEAIIYNDELIAARLDQDQFDKLIKNNELDEINGILLQEEEQLFIKIDKPYKLFLNNGAQIARDFQTLTLGKKSAGVDESNRLIGAANVFIEEGASVCCAILNATDGPIYIGKGAVIMEGSIIKGPTAICNNATVKMGTMIYGETTIGPHCKVGGEISNTVFLGYSNKAHDGYIGNSVIGEWCNLGAATTISNLKNTYDNVKVWSYIEEAFIDSGQTFHGLIMGDHSKCAINTTFNTGTVVGVGCNVFGAGFPRGFVPSFSWGGAQGFTTHQFEKVISTATAVLHRRSLEITDADRLILEFCFKESARYRTWD